MDWKRFTRGNWPYYILAVSITAVWGSTFAATKILMNGGMSPMGIFTIRFLMEYVRKHNFKPFAWYRIVLGAVVLILAAAGVL